MTQVGACCPDGSQWDSDQNKCLTVLCSEGQYYCAAQKACISGSLPCNDASVSLLLGENNVTPAGATDCPASYSGGLCATYWKVHVNFSEPFAGTPSVTVAPEKISDIGGCV